MPFIHLTTFIAAPKERVFDLSTSVDLHKASMKSHGEVIVDGVMSGLVQLNDTITWKARHLFKDRIFQSKITKFHRPDYFVDEQLKGDFAMYKHEHFFRQVQNGTIMIDQCHFETPYGIIGKLVNKFHLTKYMAALLARRNQMIKEVAESNLWTQYLNK
jgi:ligand-binding SRPBCC domain-containing protein